MMIVFCVSMLVSSVIAGLCFAHGYTAPGVMNLLVALSNAYGYVLYAGAP